MPEQPQWPERTLDMPPQDPWADPPAAPAPYPGTRPQAYEPPTAPDRAPTQQPGQSRPASQRPTSAPRPPGLVALRLDARKRRGRGGRIGPRILRRHVERPLGPLRLLRHLIPPRMRW